ncbi:hypothetical protein ElyMa_004092000 [Elysia marginata]|uniref:Uncharacterized protein n=1 Tax=Elysia marginata TaxID=1093978 RepID=A0AAV4G9S6_9GAST|nr:hypothetical protein ElyMa_004092000 [Elysia marginata]
MTGIYVDALGDLRCTKAPNSAPLINLDRGFQRRDLCDLGSRVIECRQAVVKFKVVDGQPSTSSGKRDWVVGQHWHYHFICLYLMSNGLVEPED